MTQTGLLQKIIQFPLSRILIALLVVAVPIIVIQNISALFGSSPYTPLLFTCFIVPLCFFAYWGYVNVVERRRPAEIFISGSPGELGTGILMGAGLFTTTVGILWVAGCYRVTGTNGWIVLIASLNLSVMSGFVEELIARGIIFRIMEESLGTWISLGISGAIFGALHLGNPNATLTSAVAIALEAGLLLGGCYILTRRLWFAVGVHMAWNFTQGGIFGIAVSGFASKGILQSSLSGPEFLTGGAFGAEASIVSVLVCLTGFGLIIARANRQGKILKPFWSRGNNAQAAA